MKFVILLAIFAGNACSLCAWGFFAHRKINELAVFTLPPEMFGFYKRHYRYIGEHAVDADKRRYINLSEACRHYLDGDHYEKSLPLDTIPFLWKDAVARYGEDSVTAHGIVPWHIQTVLYRLTEAFRARDYRLILKLSADLGHYTGDCHVPLHATGNYNGQRTGQEGIHGLWESRLPELFSGNFDLLTGSAHYEEHPLRAAWQAFSGSFGLADTVLSTERILSDSFPPDLKYAYELRGNVLVKVYSEAFSTTFHKRLNGMVERRMRASIAMLGNLWYTAWVNAGQPDLDTITENQQTDAEKQEEEQAEKAFRKGSMLGRKEE